MEDVIFPVMTMTGPAQDLTQPNLNQQQINPSSLLAYTGVRGLGKPSSTNTSGMVTRKVMAMPTLIYWDIYSNYYANLQEEIGVVISQEESMIGDAYEIKNITGTQDYSNLLSPQNTSITKNILALSSPESVWIIKGEGLNNNTVECNISTNGTSYSYMTVNALITEGMLRPETNHNVEQTEMRLYWYTSYSSSNLYLQANNTDAGITVIPTTVWDITRPELQTFPLSNIDTTRENILAAPSNVAYDLASEGDLPYSATYGSVTNGAGESQLRAKGVMAGLGIKTYQSDRFNNWLETEWLDGENGINAITAVDTSDGSFTMDSLNLAQKLYNVLNRIAVSGGSYKDWQEAVYAQSASFDTETPIYCGGYSAEIIFNEVVSTADAESPSTGEQALGVLGGRGTQSADKGGKIKITATEPCFIMGIISLTPRIDYSQGNQWWTRWETMNDLHKPELDAIGFQELITDEMAAWDTNVDSDGTVHYKSAGKQPAWIEYMTNVNRCYGNFSNGENEAFMTLQRSYQPTAGGSIQDLTTYIDPTKFNNTFATTDLASMHFWVQLGVGIKAKRVMSAKMIPNL